MISSQVINRVVELVLEPQVGIKRLQYRYLVQCKFLSDRQIFAEAYLRGIVSGQEGENVTEEQKITIDSQLRCDYEKMTQTGQDLTPTFMNHRASVDEMKKIVREVFNEIARLKIANASRIVIGAQLEFAINCMKRTVYRENDNLDEVRHLVNEINNAFCEVLATVTPTMTQDSSYATAFTTPSFGSSSTPYSAYATPLSQDYATCSSFPSNANVNNVRYAQPNVNVPQFLSPQQLNNNQSFVYQRSQGPFSSNMNRSILSGNANSSLIGPHKVSSTIINIISKNPFEIGVDAIDQLQTWESQALSLNVPIEYFLSYMEVLLSKEVQCWWQLHRPYINTWLQFRQQFLEDFGDQNRVIRAEQEIANLTQGENESFQQLFLRFTKLMNHVKPVKPVSDQLYILKSALKPELRGACMSVTTIAELKKRCYEYEGMDRMHLLKDSKLKTIKFNKINVIEEPKTKMDCDFWNNEAELNMITEEVDRLLVIDETLDKKKMAMSQSWTKDQKREWLSKQSCYNCDAKGHLQGQCDQKWKPHCVKCGSKQVSSIKQCTKCSGNGNPLVLKGAQH